MFDIKNLSFGFDKPILKDIDLKIEYRGQVIALLGPNGCGKTTLMNVIADLYQKYSGTIKGKGSVFFLPDHSYIPEDLTINECLELFESVYVSFNKDRAIQILKYLNLDKNKSISEYSKGMKEQLHLVFLLSQDADMYLLDEPLAAVDPLTRDILIDLIIRFKNEKSIIIISTHLVQDMEKLFDEVVFMKEGKIILHSAVEYLLNEFSPLSLDDIYKEVNRNATLD
ncbi:ABC transporter ATP-binding protein [Streptococcus sp. 121]|uniref:ABC transporter ATP-binding protein n=1 Tax=Streptococcus sp. 121 TaxID=2797637 RepID=UPI0018F08C07|nr:ABC transporter ATP-binding protein [Streptococcus sp. 121]MBJ6745978.1 ABC transporter ATP-binding protein [Streptococcus sp. 121]